MAEKEQNEGIQLAVPGVGERLRSARLARDMDIAKMAARIHLTTDVVDALERDDYSDTPARVFVRGYVRNYARTVDLPVDSVLAQFDRQWPDEDALVEISPSPRLAPDTKPGNSWPRVVTWLVLLVVFGLFLTWWQGYLDRFIGDWGGSEDAALPPAVMVPPGEQGEAAGRLPPLPELPAEALVQPREGVDLLPLNEGVGEADEAPSAVVEERVDAGEEVLPLSTSEADSPVSVGETDTVASAGSAPVMAVENEESAPAESEAEPAMPEQPAEAVSPDIVVRFSQNCWVDIRDSTRTFKLVGTLPKGSERKLGGTPPYKVILGNAEAVKIRIDGKPFDLAAHTVANVARFTLLP